MGTFGPVKQVKRVTTLVDNKKTYIVVVVALALGAVDALHIFNIPDWMFEILPIFGLGALRHAIKKSKEATEQAMSAAQSMNNVKGGNDND